LDDEKVLILTVEREYMEVAEYRVTVLREEAVPTATGVEISITPAIGAFFVGRGVIPEFQVTANLPAAGGELSYQWYMNTENSNRGGTRINEATGTTYTMKPYETMIVRTVYYYAEITNTIDGKTGVTESNPCRVTFVDINELQEKSRGTMVNIPAGEVTQNIIDAGYWSYDTWNTPGFSMGKYLVTYELWKTVFDYADAGGYRFANSGTEGGENGSISVSIGNALHPVCWINYRDEVVWCNAYSEMNGLEPVYKDSDGNVFRDSRVRVEDLIDETKMTGNGYRLPTAEEWVYAARGASPSNISPWTDNWPGTNDPDEAFQYAHNKRLTGYPFDGDGKSVEVGTLLPNSLGLFDMVGMFYTILHNINLGSAGNYAGSAITTRSGVGEFNYKYYDGSTIGGSETYENYFPYTMRLVLNKE
jgi:formylglycine-generating enzyme required for sulfatase activity